MSKDPKKTTLATGPVVYCGPTIPGKAYQYTTYNNGLPETLEAEIKEKPFLAGLVVPLEKLPEVRRQFHDGAGRYYNLYQTARANI